MAQQLHHSTHRGNAEAAVEYLSRLREHRRNALLLVTPTCRRKSKRQCSGLKMKLLPPQRPRNTKDALTPQLARVTVVVGAVEAALGQRGMAGRPRLDLEME
jgi:3-deoxy-D-manno-octulosonic-acid transferase